MKLLRNVLLVTMLVSGVGLAERITDPFERHEHDFTLEGPRQNSEVFYVSSNWYDEEGNQHDDRSGDALIAGIALSGLVVIAKEIGPDPVMAVQET
jgi:hypothetical protein